MRKTGHFMLAMSALLISGGLHAQQSEGALGAAANTTEVSARNFDAAFPDMVSVPVIQGQLEIDTTPAVQRWSVEHVDALVEIIENIGAEGLDPADYDAEALRSLIAQGPSEELDNLASRNFTWLVEDLRDGRTPMNARKQWFVEDPDRTRFVAAKVMAAAIASGDLAAALADLNPIHTDYLLLREALAQTPGREVEKRRLIQANMDRWRWLPRDLGARYLIVNVPEFQLRLIANNKVISTYRTIVGKPGRTATPQIAEEVEGLIFNPTWTVPQSIIVGEGLGRRVLNNPQWAKQRGYKATVSANGRISVVQQPGPANALGQVKLDMPNPHSIFLHDTPARQLFDNEVRALSHGCIRTDRALELAITLAIMGKGATKEEAAKIVDSGEYTKVPISQKIPVYVTYFTMGRDINGELAEFDDLYQRDAPVIESFKKARVANRKEKSSEEVVVIEHETRV
jgi:murein L,D-transpeptidase YcbB/YkuD